MGGARMRPWPMNSLCLGPARQRPYWQLANSWLNPRETGTHRVCFQVGKARGREGCPRRRHERLPPTWAGAVLKSSVTVAAVTSRGREGNVRKGGVSMRNGHVLPFYYSSCGGWGGWIYGLFLLNQTLNSGWKLPGAARWRTAADQVLLNLCETFCLVIKNPADLGSNFTPCHLLAVPFGCIL